MRAYIAAPFKRKKEALEAQNLLRELGIGSTTRWLSQHPSTDDPAELAVQAQDDLEDVDTADIFILLNYKGWVMEGQGGKHVETGYALAKGKPVYVVGKPWNVFHYLPQVKVVAGLREVASDALVQRVGEEVV